MTKKNIFSLILVALIAAIFVFASCNNGNGLNHDPGQDFDADINQGTEPEARTDQDMDQNTGLNTAPAKTVEAKYRFSGEHIYWDDNDYIIAHTKLDKNSLTIFSKNNEVSISYTDVYTQGGGLIYEKNLFGREGSWAYLYSGPDKIGYVLTIYSTFYFEYGIGKTVCKDSLKRIGPGVIPFITEDIQNAHNGMGHGYWSK